MTVLLMLTGCAARAGTTSSDVAAEPVRLECAGGFENWSIVDWSGPGRPSPGDVVHASMAGRFDAYSIGSIVVLGDAATVDVVAPKEAEAQYAMSRHDDGWWLDSRRACRAAPVAMPEHFVVEGEGTARPFDEFELQDLRTYAESSGEPLEDVLASQRGATEFRELANALESAPSSGYVTGSRDIETPGTASLSFTRRPDALTIARIGALPIDTTVHFRLPLPHAELVLYSEAVAGALSGVDGVRFLSSGPTALGDAVRLRYAVTGSAPSRAELDAAVLRATREWSTDGTLRLPVEFSVGTTDELLTW